VALAPNFLKKMAGIHWHCGTGSHASALTAGYYNTRFRDGYLAIASMVARYGVILKFYLQSTYSVLNFDLKGPDSQVLMIEKNPFQTKNSPFLEKSVEC